MKLYCKIKQDGVWKWLSADTPWKKHIARELCQCRVCKPNIVRQEKETIEKKCLHIDWPHCICLEEEE